VHRLIAHKAIPAIKVGMAALAMTAPDAKRKEANPL
jgi:hypothetical protein